MHVLICERCKNNKFIIYEHEDKLTIECSNCGNNLTIDKDVETKNIKGLIDIFQKSGSLKWYDMGD